ncbi:hypothetical protein ACFYNM_32130 [Streptomyces spororaveus]|uniref:hypothetical protein n=1 Tax=Streptomyces spororaveus TaxID=284039 RepID=UPI003686B764
MYLIHATLRAPAAGVQLPPHTRELVRALADADAEGGSVGGCGPVEHVSTHPHVLPDPILGVYLIADSLHKAERRTEALCRRALDEVPALRGWTVGRVGAPLVTSYYEQLLLASSGPAGRIRPGPLSSS